MVMVVVMIERVVPAMVVVIPWVAESVPWVIIERVIEPIIVVSIIPRVAIERAVTKIPRVIAVPPWTVGP